MTTLNFELKELILKNIEIIREQKAVITALEDKNSQLSALVNEQFKLLCTYSRCFQKKDVNYRKLNKLLADWTCEEELLKGEGLNNGRI